jgi:dihydrofolate synthase / folylpolyglutamate synthase
VTYSEAIQYLQSLQVFGARFGLETPRKLAEFAGNPQEKLRFIHVAGTNGKGSVCAMLESIYRASGFKVGLYTSPHLVSFRERIQINRQLISEADVAKHTCELMELAKRLAATSASAGAPVSKPARAEPEFGAPLQPTFFEFVTLMALKHFAEQKCELVIWETGLGGRLDATNIVTPLASVITNIGHDHQQWLGNTLAEIAFEKAGIIKRGVPVITGTDQPEALAVITETASRKNAPLTVVRSAEAIAHFPGDLKLPLLGEHQKVNAALAAATVHATHSQVPVPTDALRQGLETVSWPGRLQTIQRQFWHKSVTIILDGAHNPEGAEALARALKQQYPNARMALVLGMMADKDCEAVCTLLAPLFEDIFLAPVASKRSALPAELGWFCQVANPQAQRHLLIDPCEAIIMLPQLVPHTDVLLVTGSLYLVGEVMEWLNISASPAEGERGLNDWTSR